MQWDEFKSICEQQCELDPSRLVLVAYSGGTDSLALLISLKKVGYQVAAAHFNHHLRQAADLDEQTAKTTAKALGIPFFAGGGDVQAMAVEHKLSVEEAARQSRYQWLLEQAEACQAQAVAVAHTADDQVETVLMHLLRGTGLDGLTGMSFRQVFPVWHSPVPVVRPLLKAWRADTEAICREAGLVPVQDESNLSPRYFRNRIRLELIPYLQDYSPQIKSHILQTSQILSEEQIILNAVKEKAWQECLDKQTARWISLRLANLTALQEGLRRSVLRRGLLELEPQIRDIDFALTERLSDFVFHSSRSGEMHLTGELWIQKTANQLFLWKGKPGLAVFHPQVPNREAFKLPLPGRLSFPDWEVAVREDDLVTAREAIQQGRMVDQVWLDAESLSFPLEVRCAFPGERISPLGMDGKTQKLSDYWINHKIPRQARQRWPLIVSGQSIVWVVGLGISETASITARTQRVVQISLHFPSHQPAGLTYS